MGSLASEACGVDVSSETEGVSDGVLLLQVKGPLHCGDRNIKG